MAAPDMDALNEVRKKAEQLSAMLALITHGGPDAAQNFETVDSSVRDTYLLACADFARELADAVPEV